MATAGVLMAAIAAVLAAAGAAPYCEDVYPPLHGKLTISPDNSFYIVRCEPGYAVNGSIVVRCIDGRWNRLPPKCVPDPLAKTCPEVDAPENGHKACPNGPLYVGSRCRFRCNDEYKLIGLGLRICLPSTRWSGISSRCIPVTNESCPVPPPLRNGRIIGCSPKRVPTVGRTCHFHCREGYELRGPSTVFCRIGGKLTDADGRESLPSCEAANNPGASQSDEHEASKETNLQDSDQSSSRRPAATLSPDVTLQPAISDGDNDAERSTDASSRSVFCGDSNGGCQHYCAQDRSGSIQCSCQRGYTLASDGKSCVDIIRCPLQAVPDHASVKCKFKRSALPEAESYPVGSICSVECRKGLRYPASSNKIKCQDDGTWSDALHECKPQQCEALSIPENGDIHPPSCRTGESAVKQKCTFSCHPGYKLRGKPVVTCRNDLTWSVKETPRCQPERSRPSITCPEDIYVDLLPGAYSRNITISSPLTSLDDVEIEPRWVLTGIPVEFPAGTTNVVFKASNRRHSVQCTTSVNLADREAPVFDFCPQSFEVNDDTASGIQVTWSEPGVRDNVAIESITSTMEPNSILFPGEYNVEYLAKDVAGNAATCAFKITVI